MKRNFISVVLAVVMLFAMIPFSNAAETEVSSIEIVDLGDGFIGEISSYTIFTSNSARSVNSDIAQMKVMDVKYSGNKIGRFTLYGEFTYNGSSSKAVNHDWDAVAVSGYDYDGDSYCSGASVKGSCTFTGNGISKTVSLKITCDKNGNIS